MYTEQVNADKVSYATRLITPKVLYYGTPVILLSTVNEDGTSNLTPLSSSWALGNVLVLGLGHGSKGLENMRQHGECVVNLPDPTLWKNVEALAPLTGSNPVPEYKAKQFRFESLKFAAAALTSVESEIVRPLRVQECPLQIECEVRSIRTPDYLPFFSIVEVQTVRVHAHERIIADDFHINTDAWSPLIYNFRHYHGLAPELGKTFRA